VQQHSLQHPFHNQISTSPLGAGASSDLYLVGERCFAVGVGVFSPFGTFALLAATFFAALSIDWVSRRSLFSACFTPQFRQWDNTVVLALTRPGQVTAATLEHHSVAIEGCISHRDKVAPAAHGHGLADPKLAAKNNWGVVRRASIKPEIGACFSPTYFSSTQHPVHSPLVPTFSGKNCLPSRIHRPEQSRRTARRQRAHPSQRIRRRFLHDLARSSHLAAGYFSHAGGCTCRCSGLLLLLLLLQCDTLYITGDSLHEPLLGALEERSN
jgi:hypothetical protein